jgi:hypothetical protein
VAAMRRRRNLTGPEMVKKKGGLSPPFFIPVVLFISVYSATRLAICGIST